MVLRSSSLSRGPKLEEFEHAVALYAGASHAIAVSFGTAGLQLCMVAFEIQPGDEVIVPLFTFVATAKAIRDVWRQPRPVAT
jgi:perosamine synthetase